jgi:Transposase DDE domain
LALLRKWFVPTDDIFADLKLHGNTTWSPGDLLWTGLCWSWSAARHVTDAYAEAVEWCRTLCSSAPLSTYQGFMGAATKWTTPLLNRICPVLQQRMQEIGGNAWRICGWVPIAFDGSRAAAPRTPLNEAAFCATDYGKGQTAKYRKKKSQGLRRRKNEKAKPQPPEPQVWITLMWHMGLRLPWQWRLGPSNASERAHVMELLDSDFARHTLFCGDAGFVGYPLWSKIRQRNQHFLVRVGANVSLLTESADCHVQKDGMVFCWPKDRQAYEPPLRLRLLQVTIGKTKVWLLTSVLDPAQLTANQAVRFYQMRWGIEVEFRGLKQTLDRAKLRCRNDRRLLVELHWSILAMAVAELFALKEQRGQRPTKASQAQPRVTGNPTQRSLANTMRAMRHCLRNLDAIPEAGFDLTSQLRKAVTDGYTRTAPKRARYRPPNPDKKPLGDPKLRPLSAMEKDKLSKIPAKIAA